MAELVCRQCGEIVAPFPDGVCSEHGKLAPADICEELEFEFTCSNCGKFVSFVSERDKLCLSCLGFDDEEEARWSLDYYKVVDNEAFDKAYREGTGE